MGLDLTAATRSQKRIVSACRALAKGLTSSVPACMLYIAVCTSMWRCCDDPFHGWANFRMPVPTNGQCFWMCWSCWLLFCPLEKHWDFACKSRRGSRPTGSISPNTSSTNVFNTRLFLREDSFMKHFLWFNPQTCLEIWMFDFKTFRFQQNLGLKVCCGTTFPHGSFRRESEFICWMMNGHFILFLVSG